MNEAAAEAARRLRAKFAETLNRPGSRQGLWAFREPYTIRFGIVYGDGWTKHLAIEPVSQDQRDRLPRFWCLYSDFYEETESSYWTFVLCEPLIDTGCRKPWPTHLSRLFPVRFELVIVQTPGPIIEELSDDSDDDDETRIGDSEEESSDSGEDDEDAWAGYQPGLWQTCEFWHAYVASRDEEDWLQEWPGEDDEDAWAGYQPGLWQTCELWDAYLASIHEEDWWQEGHGEDWWQEWHGEDWW